MFHSGLQKIKMKYNFIFCFVGLVAAAHPDFDYDFSGFTNIAQLLPNNCSDIEVQVKLSFP